VRRLRRRSNWCSRACREAERGDEEEVTRCQFGLFARMVIDDTNGTPEP
jgi:hypothetical protein